METSLAYKIGQMVMAGFRGTVLDQNSALIKALRDGRLGNIWLTDNESQGNIQSPAQLSALVKKIKSCAKQPLFIAIDGEGGQVIRLKEKYGFPATKSAQALADSNNHNLTFKQALSIAGRLRDLGINLNLVPVVDLAINPDHPALTKKGRCFSDNPQIVYQHAKKTIEAHHQQGIYTCLKHFPGHGSTTGDSHLGFVDASSTWRREELEPYIKLINDNLVDMILTAHIRINKFDNQYPATLSEKIVNGLLRKELGYEGVVISDDFHMGAIYKNYSLQKSIELSINAGVDIILFSNVQEYDENIACRSIEIIKSLNKCGKISENRIDQSFSRIMSLKQKFS